jgi:hypothetical protein
MNGSIRDMLVIRNEFNIMAFEAVVEVHRFVVLSIHNLLMEVHQDPMDKEHQDLAHPDLLYHLFHPEHLYVLLFPLVHCHLSFHSGPNKKR